MNMKLFTFLTLAGLLATQSIAYGEMLSTKGNNVTLRSASSKTAEAYWEYDNGVPLQVLKKKNDWVQVSDFEGDKGWVHTKLLSPTPHLIVKANKRNRKQSINIRLKPNTKAPIIAQARYGVVFETLSQKDGWAHVRHSERGIEGWVNRSLLWGF